MTSVLQTRSYDSSSTGPLAGVRVLDLSRLVAGNVTTHLLADFGAEVLKVEDPIKGDSLRAWKTNDISTFWKVYARNKKSFALDIKSTKGREILLRLASRSHVLVESFVPGKLEELGLSPSALFEANPNLVILRISGFGQNGPDSGKPGFGTLIEALSGFAQQNGYADRPPLLPPIPLSDMVAGLYGATAVMVALREVEVRRGTGQIIDQSLLEAMLGVMGPLAADVTISNHVPGRQGSRTRITSPRNVYECAGGSFVALSAATQSTVERLFAAIGKVELFHDPRFSTNAARVEHVEALDLIITDFLSRQPRHKSVEILQAAGVAIAPLHDGAELMVDPHVVARGSIVNLPDATCTELPMHNITPRLSATPGTFRRPAPHLGEHTLETLLELGIPRDQQTAMLDEGIVAEY